jgi:putative tricarboxylic transport membrane protein
MKPIRVAAVLSVALAVAALGGAATFQDRFLTDPVGPRGLPLLAGSLLLMAGVALLREPKRELGSMDGLPKAPEGSGAQPAEGRAGNGPPPSLPLAAALLAYALLLPWLGFVTGTTLILWVTARLFGGRPRAGALAALVLAIGLWLLFDRALGVVLPVGRIWMAGS